MIVFQLLHSCQTVFTTTTTITTTTYWRSLQCKSSIFQNFKSYFAIIINGQWRVYLCLPAECSPQSLHWFWRGRLRVAAHQAGMLVRGYVLQWLSPLRTVVSCYRGRLRLQADCQLVHSALGHAVFLPQLIRDSPAIRTSLIGPTVFRGKLC